MGYTAAEAHVHADELGDTFSDDMVERIDEKLGHPDRCPHGWPVDTDVEQAENLELEPLSALEPGRARRRSCASPSTTATSCTGSTTRGSSPGAERRAARGGAGGRASSASPSTAARRRSARRPPPGSRPSGRADAASAGSRAAEAGGLAERGGLVGALPREVVVVAAEVAVRGGLRVDRPAQVEVAQDRGRAQVEVLGDERLDRASTGSFSVPNVSTSTENGCATPIA